MSGSKNTTRHTPKLSLGGNALAVKCMQISKYHLSHRTMKLMGLVAPLLLFLTPIDSIYARSLLTIIPDDGTRFLNMCRDEQRQSREFLTGLCYGYIYSKLERLTPEQQRIISKNRATYEEKYGPLQYDIRVVIYLSLKSEKLSQLIASELGKSRPLTTEKVLDYVIENIAYKERI